MQMKCIFAERCWSSNKRLGEWLCDSTSVVIPSMLTCYIRDQVHFRVLAPAHKKVQVVPEFEKHITGPAGPSQPQAFSNVQIRKGGESGLGTGHLEMHVGTFKKEASVGIASAG